jgi:hypothetical protein
MAKRPRGGLWATPGPSVPRPVSSGGGGGAPPRDYSPGEDGQRKARRSGAKSRDEDGRKARPKKGRAKGPASSWLAQPRQAIGLIVILESDRDDGSLVAATRMQDLRFQAKELFVDAKQPLICFQSSSALASQPEVRDEGSIHRRGGGLQPADNRLDTKETPTGFLQPGIQAPGSPTNQYCGALGFRRRTHSRGASRLGADSCPRLPLPPACPELRLGRFKSRHLVRGTHLP